MTQILGKKMLVTTKLVKTGKNKWEQVRSDGQSVGHCGGNWQKTTPSTAKTTTIKQKSITSTKTFGKRKVTVTRSGLNPKQIGNFDVCKMKYFYSQKYTL